MIEKIWEKVSYFTGLLTIFVLFGFMVFSANVEIKDLDLWLHLKTGEFIVQHGYVPPVDVLSCTIAGKEWVNHEWLFQVIAHLIFDNWGAEGLITMQVLVVVFTLLVLFFLGYNREKQLGVIFILLLVMMVYQTRLTIRPDIFSLLFFVLFIHILALHIDKKKSVYALFFIQVLWTNMHGFFFFGPFIVLLGICSEFIKRHVKLPWEWNQAGRLSDDEYARLKRIFLFVVLATLINPLTFQGAWYPVGVLMDLSGKSRIFFQHIQELRPPIEMNNIFSEEFFFYKVLVFISFAGFVFNRKRIDIGDLLVWLTFLLFSLAAVRNLIYFAFAAYLVCMTNFSGISLDQISPVGFKNKKFQHMTAFLAKIFLIMWMLQLGSELSNRGYYDFDKMEMKSEYGGITQRSYPNKAADFLVENNIKGNFFNDFNTGAYLVGRCFPNIKVFIDGRTEVYGPEFFRNIYQRAWKEGDAALSEAIRRFGLTGALLDSVHTPIPERTLKYFYQQKDWIPVYFDFDAVIFLKDIPENRSAIEKFRIDFSKYEAKKIDLKKLGARAVTPYQNMNRAYTLEALGFDDQAFEEASAALKVSPGYVDPYKIIGKVYGKRQQYEQAFENFRIAAMIIPGDVETRFNLALAYDNLGDYEGAVKQYKIINQQDPQNPRGHFLLSRVYIKNKQYPEALAILKKAHQIVPQASKELLELGDLLYEAKEFGTAKEVYTLALETKKDLANVHKKLGLSYQSLGLNELAQEQFKRSEEVSLNEVVPTNAVSSEK